MISSHLHLSGGVVTSVTMLIALLIAHAATSASENEDARLANPFDVDHPAGFDPHFPDRAAWEKRAESVRRQALVALGLFPLPPKTPLNPVIHGKIERDGYTVEKVFFASLPGHYVSGNLYRPTGRTEKFPAVLSPYGHWPEGRFIWNSDEKIQKALETGAESTREAARSPLQVGCVMLARMGCVVFQWDLVGYADSRKIEHRTGFLDAESLLRLQSLMGLQAWNAVRALDFVVGLPEVDAGRVAVAGASGGGTQTILLSLSDKDRVAAAFPVVMVSMNMQGGCVCENAPLLRIGTNNVELASLFAPKPQGAAAAQDWTFDFETRGLPEMKRIYGLYGASDQVGGKFFPFEHNYNLHSRELMYDFMNRALKLGLPSPVKETPFEPIPPQQLSVYDAAHPLPADATDAAGVRRWMTKVSDEQIDGLDATSLRTALQAMVVDSLPAPSGLEVSLQPGPPMEGRGWISRKGAGERVACRTVFPADWNGDVLIVPGSEPQKLQKIALDRRVAVLSVELFPGPSTRPSFESEFNPPYAGMVLCYNRSILANRVYDLLSAIALAKSWEKTRSVHLAAFGDAGPAALLAKALADNEISRAAIDLNGFDFDQVKSDSDPMLLPGGLKYGGIYSFIPLCASGQTLVTRARRTGRFDQAAANPHVTLEPDGRDADSMIEWLLR